MKSNRFAVLTLLMLLASMTGCVGEDGDGTLLVSSGQTDGGTAPRWLG